MSAIVMEADSEDLEALFDSIAKDKSARARAAAPKMEAAPKTKARVKAKAKAKAVPKADVEGEEAAAGCVINRIGHLTRTLHDALRELGYDRLLEKTAAAIPDARDRLDYVVKMTEQAAVRALNAIEASQPIQDRLGEEAGRLAAQWQRLFDRQLNVDEFKALVAGTRDYLADVPKQTRATNAQLLEIMMAQDFQDLTGQVIKKITALAQDMEQQLVHLLVDLAPADVRSEIDAGLLNGPVVNAAGGGDVVTNQNQVDDLLESLGF
ncbi:MAG: protein phosphatase CheZ [Betaproteobacteria bacterium]|nr:protein phosphatase CheZ [Betaproteobacteria bacterium]